jgi:3-oxoacyl-[acyl-carrier protein] reductase
MDAGGNDAEVSFHPLDAFRLHGKTAVVTGSAGALGSAICQMMAAAGANVVCSDLHSPAICDVAAEIRDLGGIATAVTADISAAKGAEKLMAAVDDQFGRVDVLVNGAAIQIRTDAMSTTADDLERVFAVNVVGVALASQSAARRMIQRRTGSIINIASEVIDGPGNGNVPYAVSKAAVRQLTRAFAQELSGFSIRVNAVAPGWFRSGITTARFRDATARLDETLFHAHERAMTAHYPLGKVTTTADVAYAVVYLASDASRFMTGQVLRVSGGAVMPW